MKGGTLEFDKTVRDFQAALTLLPLNDDSLMEESIDQLWIKYHDSYTGRIKLYLCLLSHSSIGDHFRDLPYYRSISYLVRKEIPTSVITKYFSFPWDHYDLGAIFLHLPHEVTWEYLQLIVSKSSHYVHPILFRILRKSLVVNCDENEFILAIESILRQYSKTQILELIFFITVDFCDVLVYESSDFVHDLFPTAESNENEEINEFSIAILDVCYKLWDTFSERISPSQLYWPLDEIDRPETEDAILKHYAHCILNSHCPDNIKSKMYPIAKEYKKYNAMSIEDLLSSSGESEWTVLWERMTADENLFLMNIKKMKESINLKLNTWSLKYLYSHFKANSLSLELKYLLRETFLLMVLPEKILFLQNFFHDFDTNTSLLKCDKFDELVKMFMNKAGDYDLITAQHDACYLALSSPKEFLNILLKEVLKGGHKVYLKILVESLQILLFHDPLTLKDRLINALLKCPDEKVPDILVSIGVIVECNCLDHLEVNIVNTAHNLFLQNKFESTCRLISGLKIMNKSINFNSNSDLLQTLFHIFKGISDSGSLSGITARIQDSILYVLKDSKTHRKELQSFIEITNNELHKLLRHNYFSSPNEENFNFDSRGKLIEYFVSVLPMTLPSEFHILFHQINFFDDKAKSILKALEIIALRSKYDLYIFRQASLEITNLALKNKCDTSFLYNFFKDFIKFIWITRDKSDILPIFEICITSFINIITESFTKDKKDIKNIIVLLNFVPTCDSKHICCKKLKHTL